MVTCVKNPASTITDSHASWRWKPCQQTRPGATYSTAGEAAVASVQIKTRTSVVTIDRKSEPLTMYTASQVW